jgi:hypothetical protein
MNGTPLAVIRFLMKLNSESVSGKTPALNLMISYILEAGSEYFFWAAEPMRKVNSELISFLILEKSRNNSLKKCDQSQSGWKRRPDQERHNLQTFQLFTKISHFKSGIQKRGLETQKAGVAELLGNKSLPNRTLIVFLLFQLIFDIQVANRLVVNENGGHK